MKQNDINCDIKNKCEWWERKKCRYRNCKSKVLILGQL